MCISGPLRLQVDATMCSRVDGATASMVQGQLPPLVAATIDALLLRYFLFWLDLCCTSSSGCRDHRCFTDAEARCVMAHDSWAAAGESQAPAIAGSRRAGRLAEAVEQLSSVELLQEHVSSGERGRRSYMRR